MKKIFFPLVIGIMLLSLSVPSSRVKAVSPGETHPDFIIAYFCGSQFYYEATDYPTHIVGVVYAYPAGGGAPADYEFWLDDPQPNAQWQETGFTIDHIEIEWGYPAYGLGYFTVNAPSCSRTGLINMYVYYSATPFFGKTHTITIFSAAGFPSKGTLTAFAGGTLPEDFSYGAPACWGVLYDDGTDKGRFDCDGFLASVGERRAYLRNDPEGPAFDLLPKIENYFKMLAELGITPQLPNPTDFAQTATG
jgi:hypothetical protein